MNETLYLSIKENLAVKKKTKLVVLLTERYAGQASFAPDVDYLGDPNHIGCTPNKQEEEPFASLCQATMHNFNNSQRS